MKNLYSALACGFSFCFAFVAHGEEKAEQTANQTAANGAIKLESVFVGDKEQPAVSYFIPWQSVGAPDQLFWNVEERHDKALDLVDREVMLRSMHFYEQMDLENQN